MSCLTTQKVKKIWLKNSFKNSSEPTSTLLCQVDQFLISFFTFWTSIKSWLSELWASSNWEESPEPSEPSSCQNSTLQLPKKSVSQMMSELRKLPLKKLLSSKDPLKTADFLQSFWEEAQETFWRILKEPLTTESMFIDPWSNNQSLSQELEVSKFFFPKSLKLRPRNLLDLTNTVIIGLPRHFKFSQGSYRKTQAWTQTKWFQSLFHRTNKLHMDLTSWLEMSKRSKIYKFTTTERQKNGPSDSLLKPPSQF